MVTTPVRIGRGMQIVTSVVSLSIVLVVGVFIARSQRAGAPTHVASTINLDAVPNPFGSNKNGSYQADIVDIGRTARGAIVKKVTFPGTLRKEHLATDAVYMILWPANVPTGKSLEAMYQEANNFIRKKGFGYVYTANAATEIANDKTNLPFNQKFPNIFFMQPEVLNDPQQLADIRAFEAAYNVTFRVAGDRPSTDNGVRLAPGRIMAYIVNSDAGIDIDLDAAKCSNAFMEGAEQCDDGNGNNNDGCSLNCTIETGYTCVGNPSVCTGGTTAGATAGNTAGNTAGDTAGDTGSTSSVPVMSDCSNPPTITVSGVVQEKVGSSSLVVQSANYKYLFNANVNISNIYDANGAVMTYANVRVGSSITLQNVRIGTINGAYNVNNGRAIVAGAPIVSDCSNSPTITVSGVVQEKLGSSSLVVQSTNYKYLFNADVNPSNIYDANGAVMTYANVPAGSAIALQNVLIAPLNGTYTVDGGSAIITSTGGDLTLCGNGDLDSGEQCDDGNADNGDGCTTSCGIENGYACRAIGDPICTQKICSDSDDGNDYVSKGTVEYTDFQSTSVSDACVTLEGSAYLPADYCLGTNCFVKEYYCTTSASMASEVISCNGYCNDGACISCGNGRIETGLGEQCDNGVALNGTESNDCRSDCKLVVPPAFGNQ